MFPKNFFKIICYVKIERMLSNLLLKLEITHQKYEFFDTDYRIVEMWFFLALWQSIFFIAQSNRINFFAMSLNLGAKIRKNQDLAAAKS